MGFGGPFRSTLQWALLGLKYKLLHTVSESHFKLFRFLNFGKRQRPQLLLDPSPVVRHQGIRNS